MHFKVLFMYKEQDPIATLHEIKSMMEKSSRFISLSGLSGVAAGLIALVGAYMAHVEMNTNEQITDSLPLYIGSELFYIALGTLSLALVAGFLFTYLKSKKLSQPIWNNSSRRLLINLFVPLIASGCYLLKMIDLGYAAMIAPGCLILYGIALVNASKYTLDDIRYLGYVEIVLGLINLLFLGQGLYFWALGFGIAHILYGLYMWNKYDKVAQ